VKWEEWIQVQDKVKLLLTELVVHLLIFTPNALSTFKEILVITASGLMEPTFGMNVASHV
jgi:hypothetical protein